MLKPLLCICVCVCVCQPLRILCPFNHGPAPCGALRLNHSRGVRETMPRCLCDKNITGCVWQCGYGGCFCMCVYVPPLLWSGNGMWMGSLRAWKKKEDAVFFIIAVAVCFEGRGSSHEWQRGEACEKHDLAPRFLLSLLPAHLIALGSTDNIRHVPHGGEVRGHVISDITFLLRTYLYQELPPSFSVSTAKYFTALCQDKCPSQGFFPFVSRWRLLVFIMVVCGGPSTSGFKGRVFKTVWNYIRLFLLHLTML